MLAYRVIVRACMCLYKHTVMNILISILISTLMLGNIHGIWASLFRALPVISYIGNRMCAGKLTCAHY